MPKKLIGKWMASRAERTEEKIPQPNQSAVRIFLVNLALLAAILALVRIVDPSRLWDTMVGFPVMLLFANWIVFAYRRTRAGSDATAE